MCRLHYINSSRDQAKWEEYKIKPKDVLNTVRMSFMCEHGELVMAVVVVGWFRASGCRKKTLHLSLEI